jgi:hypothetical protein
MDSFKGHIVNLLNALAIRKLQASMKPVYTILSQVKVEMICKAKKSVIDFVTWMHLACTCFLVAYRSFLEIIHDVPYSPSPSDFFS